MTKLGLGLFVLAMVFYICDFVGLTPGSAVAGNVTLVLAMISAATGVLMVSQAHHPRLRHRTH